MPTRHRLKVQVPIPQEVSPAHVIATLQTFEPLLINHHYIADYNPVSGPICSRDLAMIKRDPFFQDDCDDLAPECTAGRNSRWWICDVWEDVYWVPFLLPYFSRLKRFLAIGCKTASGIRFRQSIAGGVTTRGTFTVVSRKTGRAYRGGDSNTTTRNSWDGDTATLSSTGEEKKAGQDEAKRTGSRDSAADDEEKRPKSWDGETDIESEAEAEAEAESEPDEPAWEIVCECEIEVPLIISVPQLLMRNANRKLCEHLCKSVIHASLAEWNEYWFTI